MVNRKNGRRIDRPSEPEPSLAGAGRGRAEADGRSAGRNDGSRGSGLDSASGCLKYCLSGPMGVGCICSAQELWPAATERRT